MDMLRASNRLKGIEKRKTRPINRPPLADIPVAINEDEVEKSLGARAVRKLQAEALHSKT